MLCAFSWHVSIKLIISNKIEMRCLFIRGLKIEGKGTTFLSDEEKWVKI
jgi:hypothetical protein